MAETRTADEAAKERDHRRCRIPEDFGTHDGPIYSAHIFEADEIGGDHSHWSDTSNLMTVCRGHDRTGVISLQGAQIKVVAETERGADDVCSFWRRGENGEYFMVRREISIAPFTYERD